MRIGSMSMASRRSTQNNPPLSPIDPSSHPMPKILIINLISTIIAMWLQLILRRSHYPGMRVEESLTRWLIILLQDLSPKHQGEHHKLKMSDLIKDQEHLQLKALLQHSNWMLVRNLVTTNCLYMLMLGLLNWTPFMNIWTTSALHLNQHALSSKHSSSRHRRKYQMNLKLIPK